MPDSSLALLLVQALLASASMSDPQPAEFAGICEASAAAEVSQGLVAVGDDETNNLQLYKLPDGKRVTITELSAFLDAYPEDGVDIEGAARAGDTTYWITSHSLTKKAKFKKERFRLFATRIETRDGKVRVTTTGRAYHDLQKDIVSSITDARWSLADAAKRSPEGGLTEAEARREEEAAAPIEYSPETVLLHREGGFNIEGLAEGPRGTLLLGFRSPVRAGMALIVPLKDPQLLTDAAAGDADGRRAEFEAPIGVDLGGLGIRSLERIRGTDDYVISAGPVRDGAGFRLYRWHYGDSAATLLEAEVGDLIAEGLVQPSGGGNTVLLLSDEGDTERCQPPRFRASFVPLGANGR